MTDELPWHLLDRYFADECSPEEAARIEASVAGDPERVKRLESVREIWARSESRPRRFDVDGAWEATRSRTPSRDRASAGERSDLITLYRQPARPRSPQGPAPAAARSVARASRITLAAAAVVLLLVVSGGLLARLGIFEPAGAPMHAYETQVGQQAQLRLGDGSRVVLSADTRLRVPAGYGSGARDVYIDRGEAFFEIDHDPSSPFRVHGPGAVAEDLGTEFLVRTDAAGAALQVVVASGEVALRAEGTPARDAVSLTAGRLGRISHSGRIEVDSTVDVQAHLGWLDGRLAFDDVPLAEVLRDLRRWYGVEFRMADPSLAEVPVTASFEAQPLDGLLHTLTAALDVRARTAGDTITLFLPEP